MTATTLPPRIPPLPRNVLMDVQEVEEHLRASLDAAANRRPHLNVEQVRRALDTCVVEALNLQLEYYASLPNYRPEWVPALAVRTIDSAIGSFPLLTDGEPFRERLQQTVRHYLQGRRKAKLQPVPQLAMPASEPLNEQIEALRDECRMTVEELAEGLGVTPRSAYRHLSGEATPRQKQVAAYEKLFSQKLGRKVRLETSVERQ